MPVLAQCRPGGRPEIAHPDFPRLEQAPHEAVARRVHQSDHLGRPAGLVQRRNVGHQRKRDGIEHLDASRHVIRHRHQPAVLGDRATDAVAGLHHPPDDAHGQQVHLGEAAIAAEHVSVAAIAGIIQRGMREVAQALHLPQHRASAGFDNTHPPGGALDHDTQVAGSAQRRIGAALQEKQCCKQAG